MRTTLHTFAILLAGGALLAFTACGDSESTTGVACPNGDADCAFGTVCGATGSCEELPCQSSGDCLNGDQACVTVGAADVCAAVSCGCANCDPCALGLSCVNGSCQAPNTCANDTECGQDQVCDTTTSMCRACQGTECMTTGADCTLDGCQTGFTCNTTTKMCDMDVVVTAGACDTCASVDDCGGSPWKCAPLLNGNSCLPGCASANECPTGWLCQGGSCTPENFDCAGCIVDGCAANQACNPGNKACETVVAACDGCTNDWQCGAGSACDSSQCVQRCTNGVCPSGGTCRTTANGLSVCADACAAACTPACSGAQPHCVDGMCSACRDGNDCNSDQTCDLVNGLCTGGGGCMAPTPYYWNGTCVACISNDHCAPNFCDSGSNTCVSDVCASCSDPYPACTQVGTDFYCVQCTDNSHCGTGTCNTATYACEGGVVSGSSCTSSADCDPGASGFNLQCDTTTGLCYDTDNGCDDVTAFCRPPAGSTTPGECLSLLDLFPGGGLPIPGGTGIPGFCSCEPAAIFCDNGALCLDLNAILAALSGSSAPPGQGGAFCFDLSALLGGTP